MADARPFLSFESQLTKAAAVVCWPIGALLIWRGWQVEPIRSYLMGHVVQLSCAAVIIVGLLVARARASRQATYFVTLVWHRVWGRGLAFVAIAALVVAYLMPIYWIVLTSLNPSSDVVTNVRFTPTLKNFDNLLFEHDSSTGGRTGTAQYPRQLMNSVIVCTVSTFLVVALGALAAYATARFNIKAKADLLFFILSTRMLPAVVIAIPVFLMYTALGLIDTYIGLILLYTVFNVSFATWLMKGFFDEIPREYEDAALLDGYSRFSAFRKVVLPQVMPGIAATAVFCLLTSWNEFAFALFLTTSREMRTAPPGIISAFGNSVEWGQIAAGALLFVLPVAMFTFLMRNYLLRGVTFGAIKR